MHFIPIQVWQIYNPLVYTEYILNLGCCMTISHTAAVNHTKADNHSALLSKLNLAYTKKKKTKKHSLNSTHAKHVKMALKWEATTQQISALTNFQLLVMIRYCYTGLIQHWTWRWIKISMFLNSACFIVNELKINTDFWDVSEHKHLGIKVSQFVTVSVWQN